MIRSRFPLFCCSFALLLSAVAAAPQRAPAPESGLRLTIYQDDFAQITQRLTLAEPLKKGSNTLRFTDLPATLDPATLRLRSRTDLSATVSEQAFGFDTLSTERLLARSLDQKIVVHLRTGKTHEGVLLNYDDRQLVLAADHDKGPVLIVNRGANVQRLQFPALPEGLLTKPVLTCEVSTEKAGQHELELNYLAGQLRWRVDYTLMLTADESAADLHGWVTIENKSGKAFEHATIKLLAGEPRLDAASAEWSSCQDSYKYARRAAPATKPGVDRGRVVGEYRAYELPERMTLADQQLKQIELRTAPKIEVVKTYLFDGAQVGGLRSERKLDKSVGAVGASRPAHVVLEVSNQAPQLGVTLPRGKLRAYKRDRDGRPEFLGEDLVFHTARDEKLILHIGNAFDILGERKQTAFEQVNNRVAEETIEVRLSNRKQVPVTVNVLERFFRSSDWTLIDKSHEPQNLDSRTVLFPVNIPAGGEAVVSYTVRYQF